MIPDAHDLHLYLKTQILGRQFHCFEMVDSTNRLALELLRDGAIEGTTVLAAAQTSGRGSSGRTWQSAPGGMYLSVILRPSLALENIYQLTLVAAYGIVRSLSRVTGVDIRLKWPNDLVIQQAGKLGKVGGILTETRIQGGVLSGAVIGVGINWQNPVPDVGVRLGSLSRTPLDITLLAATVLGGLEESYFTWQSRGLASIINGYERYLINLGQPVRTPSHDGEGHVIGINAQGALRVLFLDGTQALLAPHGCSLGYQA